MSTTRKIPAESNPGSHAKGQKRFDKIVECALQLLIERGYHNFSMRKVADAAGISIGNLQYYFPCKDALVEAMLDNTLQAYNELFNEIRHRGTPRQQFIELVTAVTRDLGTRKTTVFFPEVWSLSNHEQAVTGMMDAMYDNYRHIVSDIILEINPQLSAAQASRLALFFTCSIEGHTVFIGYKKPWNKETDNIANIATQSFLWLIEHGEIPAD
ncbi:MAG: TetR/AcrR family transcriptional regulator [Gammaproteobacteria bacterium]|nr:TetR/AcrR family transcriptional regulator [Gammaproteobacteria bacterium]